jgi:predicted PolB exonuclease-like 3'-5' exonuclease
MPTNVLVWDLETVPDIKGFAAANGHDGKSDEEIRAAIGDKFPKHLYHSIICIGALIAHYDDDHWDSIGAPHVGERSEKELISAFVNRIAELNPQLVTFNGSSFDLPELVEVGGKHGADEGRHGMLRLAHRQADCGLAGHDADAFGQPAIAGSRSSKAHRRPQALV